MFNNIVIPVDLADKGSFKMIFSAATNFINAFKAQIHFVHIIPNLGMKMVEDYLPRNWKISQENKYNSQLKDLIAKYIPDDIQTESYIGRGAIYDQVINYSERIKADLIIISAIRPELKDYMLGPNASKIVRHSAISVLVVRE
jgi:universal stress protein F